MRELEREQPTDTPHCERLTVLGRGRLGTALSGALRASGYTVSGPLDRAGAREAGLAESGIVLLCVPDGEIAAAAARIEPGPLVGHCSGATGLEALGSHEGFSLHPLMTVTRDGADFAGAGAAIAGCTPRALSTARALASGLGMHPVEVAAEDRVAYHAAASIASNLLITLEAAAERLAGTAGVDRALLVPLVRQTVENWAGAGAERALTGPIARGDEATVAAHREAVGERAPDLLAMFDALTEATRALAAGREALAR